MDNNVSCCESQNQTKPRKPKLYNKCNPKELKERLFKETEPRVTVSFYKYFKISDPNIFRDELYINLEKLNVFGRIYIAHEGINAQASVPQSKFEQFKDYLYSIPQLNNLRINIAVEDDGKSFWVLKIKTRKSIVADGITDPTFTMDKTGKYLDAKQFNILADKPDTIIIDMRNHYEYEVGHFKNAIEIPSDTFREQLPMAVDMMRGNEDKDIIMYCTGGIRCEKASSWMLHNGFKNVYHVEGGIIHYANNVKAQGLENKFIGKNFVFDNRLGEQIGDEIISHCHQCGAVADTHTNCVNNGCHLLFIQCSKCKTQYDNCCSNECQEIIKLPEEQQKLLRKGIAKGQNIFNKSRFRAKSR